MREPFGEGLPLSVVRIGMGRSGKGGDSRHTHGRAPTNSFKHKRLSQNLFLFLGVGDGPRVVIYVCGASPVGGEAYGTVGGIFSRTAVVHTGVTAGHGLVSAVNAETGLGGNDFSTFGTSF